MSGLKRKADSNPQVYGSASSASDDPDLSAASKTTRSQRKPQLRKTVRDRTHSLKQRVENTSKSTISVDDSITMNSSKRKSKKSRISIITLDDSDDDCCFIIQSKATHIEANAKGKENKVVRNNKNNTQNHMIFDSNKLACSANNEIIIIEDNMIQINSLDEMKNIVKKQKFILKMLMHY
ncbi:hypothetical protein HHI36_011086 [Cryptolaemus montrouzieri]|uniref:Uncharacterized protein n=1 Tax=Cryptolaemus montrouzieri TaxID=559131 RepID=A0ABD2MLJ4_9CUCU